MKHSNYNAVLSDLELLIGHNEKQAEAQLADENVLDGDRRATSPQGKPVSEAAKEGDVDTGVPTPSATNDSTKSVDYQVNPDSKDTKVVGKELADQVKASSQMGTSLLETIKVALDKEAKEKEEKEKKPADKKEDKKEDKKDDSATPTAPVQDQAPVPVEADISDAAAAAAEIDVALDQQDLAILAEIGSKSASDVSKYLMAKQAGYEHMHGQIAATLNANAQAQTQPQAQPSTEFAKQASHYAGAVVSQLENEGLICSAQDVEKIASTKAGAMFATLESEGKLFAVDNVKVLMKEARLHGFEAGVAVGVNCGPKMEQDTKEKIVKEASASETEAILQDLAKRDVARKANNAFQKKAAELMTVRPIMTALLAAGTITDEEKSAMLDYIGGVEDLNSEALKKASEMSSNSAAVLASLSAMEQKHTEKPVEEAPQEPVSEPLPSADGSMKNIVDKMLS